MLLLSFTVRNHKSIRDEVSLDLLKPTLRTLRPQAGESWRQHVFPIAGIFGSNATGKSTVLDALYYAFAAISASSTKWLARKVMPRAPFRLDDVSEASPSRYELDFVHDDRRYVYGFEVDDKGIAREWLRDVPSTRWRTLLERDRERGLVKTHPSIGALGRVSDRELVLSRARVVGHGLLGPVADDLVSSFEWTSVKDADRARRLAGLADALFEESVAPDDIVALLKVADIGIESIGVKEKGIPQELREALVGLFRAQLVSSADTVQENDGDAEAPERENLSEQASVAVARSLTFSHRSSRDDPPAFYIQDESDGTIAWLALAVPALAVLRRGGFYCLDEIDSSLHPHLVDLLLGAFADPGVNVRGAQLIFTSHETFVLSPLSEVELEPEQVWFTDKSREGATELFCLDDFPRHRGANVAKRYLEGRYGGTPRLAPGILSGLIADGVNV